MSRAFLSFLAVVKLFVRWGRVRSLRAVKREKALRSPACRTYFRRSFPKIPFVPARRFARATRNRREPCIWRAAPTRFRACLGQQRPGALRQHIRRIRTNIPSNEIPRLRPLRPTLRTRPAPLFLLPFPQQHASTLSRRSDSGKTEPLAEAHRVLQTRRKAFERRTLHQWHRAEARIAVRAQARSC